MKNPTRRNPVTGVEQILDPVITTLEAYYQKPQCLAPLDPDPDTSGKPSDHRIVVVTPVSAINNQSARTTRNIIVRPITESGLHKKRLWFQIQNWSNIFQEDCAHKKLISCNKCYYRTSKNIS